MAAKSISKQFVTAGKAVFTVANNKGDHYTFRVKRSKGTLQYPPACFVSLLTGPDNTSSYSYLGMLNETTGQVKLTAKSKLKDDSVPVKVVRWALGKVWAGAELPEGYAIHHEGKCGRCGRALTVPESIENGIGPECIKHVGPIMKPAPKAEAPKPAPAKEEPVVKFPWTLHSNGVYSAEASDLTNRSTDCPKCGKPAVGINYVSERTADEVIGWQGKHACGAELFIIND